MSRGLISYDQCSIAELQKFAIDRSIQRWFPTPPNRRALITKLERANDAATFDPFEDLPPELRTRIYKLYFESLELPALPAQPPLTEVSRLVRKEALPLFYSCSTFQIQGHLGAEIDDTETSTRPWVTRARGGCAISLDRKTDIFFAKTGQRHMKRIQNVRLPLRYSWNAKLAWEARAGRAENRQYAISVGANSAKLEGWFGDDSKKWCDRVTEGLTEVSNCRH